MVILYPSALPPGALVRPDRSPPAPVWLSAAALTPPRVTHWPAMGGAWAAEAVAANASGTLCQTQPHALSFETGVNGGLMLAGAIPAAECVTLGLVCAGLAEARSLMALQPRGGEGYVFLAAERGLLRLGQKGGAAELALALPEDGAALVLCALSGGEVRLAVNGGAAQAVPLDFPPGPADVFLGCRGPQAGLRNKLGRFRLSDVLVWPGQDLLARPGDPGLAGARAFWQERRRDGL
jgi:hypothetical protein